MKNLKNIENFLNESIIEENKILQILENMYRIYGEDRYRTSIYLAKKAVQGQAQQTQQHPLRVAG